MKMGEMGRMATWSGPLLFDFVVGYHTGLKFEFYTLHIKSVFASPAYPKYLDTVSPEHMCTGP